MGLYTEGIGTGNSATPLTAYVLAMQCALQLADRRAVRRAVLTQRVLQSICPRNVKLINKVPIVLRAQYAVSGSIRTSSMWVNEGEPAEPVCGVWYCQRLC
eukprot:1258744-Rhodomonas_salina.5